MRRVAVLVPLGAFGACEADIPPGLGDRIPDADLEVVDAGGSPLGIGQRVRLAGFEGR